MAPASVTVPEQLVLVAVSVLEVKPKLERQALELPPLPAWVTVRVPDSVAARATTSEKSTFVWPALSRERFRVPAVVEPLIAKFSVPSVELGVASYARTVVVWVASHHGREDEHGHDQNAFAVVLCVQPPRGVRLGWLGGPTHRDRVRLDAARAVAGHGRRARTRQVRPALAGG